MKAIKKNNKLRVGIVVPHIFLHQDILPNVIFSPGKLALDLASGLKNLGLQVYLFSPGPINSLATNITSDLTYFEQELEGRGDQYLDLLKKHPFIFITLARQVQSEIIAKAYQLANEDKLDIIHIYTNEEEIALSFARLCKKPVVFTHHDPFNFLIKYKNIFPKYKNLNWISMSFSQREGMPKDTNWVGNIYHGLDPDSLTPINNPVGNYFAYIGRIIEAKGLHLAIEAAKKAKVKLKIVGKHYSSDKDEYWNNKILPQLDKNTEYLGFIKDTDQKKDFLGNAKAVIVPSIFNEPFGMVNIESLACGTPVIGLNAGATREIIKSGKTGFIVNKEDSDYGIINNIILAMKKIGSIDRKVCRQDFENRFTLNRMCQDHLDVYKKLTI